MHPSQFGLLAVCALLAVPHAHSQPSATGIVYHDLNGDGMRQADEPGIPDVRVTNGVDLARTDANGVYTIEVAEDTIISIIKPRGWLPRLDDRGLPQYFYIHKPQGSPELAYPGVAPTGPLPESIDFPLTPNNEPDKFTIFAFGDPQPVNMTEVDYFTRDIVEPIIGKHDVAFGITLGDIVNDPLELFAPMIDAHSQLGVPWYYVYGNHDMNFDATSDAYADETFERVFGPANYAFEWGPVLFVVLDNVIYPDPDPDSFYIGGLNDDQLTFLENIVESTPDDQLLVLSMHIPLFQEDYRDYTFIPEQRDRLFEILARQDHTLSLSAHTHYLRHAYFDEDDGWEGDEPHHHFNVGTTSGSWWRGEPDASGIPHTTMRDGTPNGYALIHFDGDTYHSEFFVARGPGSETMRVWSPRVIRKGDNWTSRFFANVYNARPDDVVEYRIAKGEWRPMRKEIRPDPYYQHLQFAYETTVDLPEGRRLPLPVDSHHLWTGRLDANLRDGAHLVEVRWTDQRGHQHIASAVYRIVRPEN